MFGVDELIAAAVLLIALLCCWRAVARSDLEPCGRTMVVAFVPLETEAYWFLITVLIVVTAVFTGPTLCSL